MSVLHTTISIFYNDKWMIELYKDTLPLSPSLLGATLKDYTDDKNGFKTILTQKMFTNKYKFHKQVQKNPNNTMN